MKKRLIYLALTALTWMGVLATPLPDSVKVSIITYYPGSEEFSVFGHTDLRLQCSDGSDWIFNYGVFDFDSPGFIYRFVSGEADYMCEAYPTAYLTIGNKGRKMVEQDLNMTQSQSMWLLTFLSHNARPENRNYRYRYFSDNCSTRPLDVIEQALQSELSFADDGKRETFRQIVRHYTANYAWESLGIDLALGTDADRVISRREKMFVPLLLMDDLREEMIEIDGKKEKLVTGERVINPGSDNGLLKSPTPWWCHPLTASLAVMAVMIALSVYDIRRRKVLRIADTVLYTIATIAGLMTWYIVFISTHEATSPNFNTVWLHPFYIVPAVMMWIKRGKNVLFYSHYVIFALLFFALIQWPIVGQSPNAAFFPLIVALMSRSVNYLIINRK